LFLVEVLGDEEEVADEEAVFNGEVEFEAEELTPQISINTMHGHAGFSTMRVNGHKGKNPAHSDRLG